MGRFVRLLILVAAVNDTAPKPLTCRSVGWLAYDGKDCKLLIPHISEGEDQGGGDMTIPTRAVRSMVDLVTRSRRRKR
ncbi:MAG: hypothetical protein KF902_14075 [Phycisphaeraceae bacterium]|nr:hypothetical protein [Phycisphaeraceae bacterium]